MNKDKKSNSLKIFTQKKAKKEPIGSYYHPTEHTYRTDVCPKGYIAKEGYDKKSYTTKKGSKISETHVGTTCIKERGLPGKVLDEYKVITISNKNKLSNYGYSTKKSVNVRHKALLEAIKEYSYLSVLRKLVALRTLTRDSNPEQSQIHDIDIKKLQMWRKSNPELGKNIKMKGGGIDDVFDKKMKELDELIQDGNDKLLFIFNLENKQERREAFFNIQKKFNSKTEKTKLISLIIYDNDNEIFNNSSLEIYYPSYYSDNSPEQRKSINFWNSLIFKESTTEYLFNYEGNLIFKSSNNKNSEINKLRELLALKGQLCTFSIANDNKWEIRGRFYPLFDVNSSFPSIKQIYNLSSTIYRENIDRKYLVDFNHAVLRYIYFTNSLLAPQQQKKIIGGFILACNNNGVANIKRAEYGRAMIEYLIPSQYGIFTKGKKRAIDFYKNVTATPITLA